MLVVLIALLLGAAVDRASAQITVAAAADLGPVLQKIGNDYEHKTGNAVRVSLGASGNLTQQIKNGAPFDVFLSADEEYPKQLIEAGLAERSSLYRYAVGKLVVWTPAGSALDFSHGMNVLLDPSVKKIAIANPQHAPYGRAAVAALKHFGLYDKLASRLVLGENVSQAAQFVESGNAQAGLIALSHAMEAGARDKGRYWIVPADSYPELNQAAVIISRSRHHQEAAKFLDFLQGAEARSLLQQYGFSTSGDKH